MDNNRKSIGESFGKNNDKEYEDYEGMPEADFTENDNILNHENTLNDSDENGQNSVALNDFQADEDMTDITNDTEKNAAIDINEMNLAIDDDGRSDDYSNYDVDIDIDIDYSDYSGTDDNTYYQNDSQGEGQGAAAVLYEWIHVLIVAVSTVVILLTFVFRLVNVDGTSMKDTLQDNDKVIVTNMGYEPKDGDIIVISHTEAHKTPLIKRVIAKAGQSLKIDSETGEITVDGVIIDEPYIKDITKTSDSSEIPEIVPEGKIFVMGDNRLVSMDSRSQGVGLIDEIDVIGKAQTIVFPFERFDLFI